jgi:hypothetical protein
VAMTLVRGCHACRAFPATRIAIYNWELISLLRPLLMKLGHSEVARE